MDACFVEDRVKLQLVVPRDVVLRNCDKYGLDEHAYALNLEDSLIASAIPGVKVCGMCWYSDIVIDITAPLEEVTDTANAALKWLIEKTR